MLWFNNNRSGRFKLIEKIDSLISMLNKRWFTNLQNVDALSIVNVWSVFKYQCLSFMYDLCNNNFSDPFFPLPVNNMVYLHINYSIVHQLICILIMLVLLISVTLFIIELLFGTTVLFMFAHY